MMYLVLCVLRILNLLAVGTDTPLLTELLLYSGSLTKRSTIHSSTFELHGGTRKEGTTCFIEGMHQAEGYYV